LSLIAFARNRGVVSLNSYFPFLFHYIILFIRLKDYIFSLLMGYQDPPAGIEKKEGLDYNPYFNGSWIAMPSPLYDDIIEYSDG